MPRGSIAVINNAANAVIPTSTPISTKISLSVHVALLEIEKVIGSKKHLHMNRLIVGYDVPGDSLRIAWKTLYNDWIHIKGQIQTRSFNEHSLLSEDIEPIVNSVLKYPVVEQNSQKPRKKTDLPKHMTSKNALKILKLQEEKKRCVEIVKEAKRPKKITKSLKTKTKIVSKENVSADIIPSRRSTPPKKKRKFDDEESLMSQEDKSDSEESVIEENAESEYKDEEYFCSICNREYVDGELWLQCDKCSNWFHAAHTNMSKHTKSSLTVWICGNCCTNRNNSNSKDNNTLFSISDIVMKV